MVSARSGRLAAGDGEEGLEARSPADGWAVGYPAEQVPMGEHRFVSTGHAAGNTLSCSVAVTMRLPPEAPRHITGRPSGPKRIVGLIVDTGRRPGPGAGWAPG